MEIKDIEQDGVAILILSGRVDDRDARGLEQKIRQLIAKGRRRLVLDFQQVELFAPAGLRVLRLVAQMLKGGGGLALCALGSQATNVIRISGLAGQFIIAPTREEALDRLFASCGLSPLTVAVSRILGDAALATPPPAGERSPLANEVARWLGESPPPSG